MILADFQAFPFHRNPPNLIIQPYVQVCRTLREDRMTIDFFQVLVELAQLQDEEVGDGTTSVVIIAAELLKNADDLVKQKIHPTSIIAGYRLACKEACKYIQENLTYSVDTLGEECLINAAKVNISIIEQYEQFMQICGAS